MSHLIMNNLALEGYYVESSQKELLLGVTIDKELKFDNHINYICKKAGQKLNASARIAPFMDTNKERTIMKGFAESQFSCCPLI